MRNPQPRTGQPKTVSGLSAATPIPSAESTDDPSAVRGTREVTEVTRAIAKIQAGVLAITCAVIGGVGLFAMTAWLIIKDGPEVGLHLQLLRHYFMGYSVSWPGSLIGLVYGAVVGGVIGWSVGRIYNGVVRFRERESRFRDSRPMR